MSHSSFHHSFRMSLNDSPSISPSLAITTPREIAYVGLLRSLKQEGFIADFLRKWDKEAHPSTQDYHLAHEISFGSARMALTLDYIAAQHSSQKKLNIKLKERALLRTAVYQLCFMDSLPDYAIVDETIKIARRHYLHSTFVKFLNATLRKIAQAPRPPLPSENSLLELSVRYSYPPFFIQELTEKYSWKEVKIILEAGNTPAPTMMRIRDSKEWLNYELVSEGRFPVTLLKNPKNLTQIAADPRFYIQNVTPTLLFAHLASSSLSPKRILDLCASPGGKTLLVHDLYPQAKLYANDVSPFKIEKLKENFDKYKISVELSCSKGEDFSSPHKFDLIILDVPCSNSGVLNKRPEARWRLSESSTALLTHTQLHLLKQAAHLLSAEGEIWYLTCSILSEENEALIHKACSEFNLHVRTQKTILPSLEGQDGGFCCALYREER